MNDNSIAFLVEGVPVPQGSMKSFGRGRMVHQNGKELHAWRDKIANAARKKMKETEWEFAYKPTAISIEYTFVLPRPKSHKNDTHMTTRPDLDKLIRAVNDALTEVLYEDDSQIDHINAQKMYEVEKDGTGVIIKVSRC